MATSQTIELSGGYIINRMFDFEEDNPHYRSEYNTGSGYGFVIAIEDIKVDWHRLRITLGFEKYNGELEVYSGGLGGGGGTHAFFDKSLISLGLYPVNFMIVKKIDLNIGIIASILIHERFNGTYGGWMMTGPGFHYNIEDQYSQYNSNWYFGLSGRIAYNIKVSPSVYIFPQYSFYFGVSKEFCEFPYDTRSMRHFFAVGVEKRFQKKTKH